MADNQNSPKRKKLRLKTTGQGKPAKPETSAAPIPPEAESNGAAEDASPQDSGETASLQDPLAVRDTQSVKKLKRLQPNDSPATANALTESGQLGPPGSDTVRLKVVKDARQSRKSGKGEGDGGKETIRLSSAEQQSESAPVESKAKSYAGDTLRVKPASSGEGESTHTATLRVAKSPQHQNREEIAAAAPPKQSPAGETQAPQQKKSKTGTETLRVKRREKAARDGAEATASTEEKKSPETPEKPAAEETQTPEKKSKTGTETLRVKPRDKAARDASETTAATEKPAEAAPKKTSGAAQTQAVKPQDQQATSTSTLKVTRPVKPPKFAADSGQRTQTVRAGDNETQDQQTSETAAAGSDETQNAVPASKAKPATAPLQKESQAQAKKQSEDDKDTIRIKPPSQAKTFAKPEKAEKAEGAGSAAAAGQAGKGTGKITLKVKKKSADKTMSLEETEEAKDTVQVPEQEPEETAEAPASGSGRKTLRLKGEETKEKAGPSAEDVGQAVEESGASKPKTEPGVFMTVAAAASLIGVGVLTFFAVYQYMNLF